MGHFQSLDRSEFLSAVEDWRSGTMTEAEAVRFKEILRNDVHACQMFIEYGDLLTHLALEVPQQTASVDTLVAGTLNADRRSWRRSDWMTFASGLLLATVGAMLMAVILLSPPRSRPIATVRDVHSLHSQQELTGLTVNAAIPKAFSAGTILMENDELVLSDSNLFVTVEFTSGASLLLQGPATLIFKTENSAELKTGRALGSVPASAVGFTLQVPSGLVRDLGTEFAVDANETQTQVSVQTGEVECELKSPLTAPLKSRLGNGESVRLDVVTKSMQVLETPPASLDQIVGFHSGIVGIKGPVRFSPEPPPRHSDRKSIVADTVLVYPERRNISVTTTSDRLVFEAVPSTAAEDSPVELQFDSVSSQNPQQGASPETLHADCYLIRLKTDDRKTLHLTGSVAFRQEIIGVITSSARLTATDALLNSREFADDFLKKPIASRGCEANTDIVEISPDGKTLKFTLRTGGGGAGDEFRVLVRNPSAKELEGSDAL